MHTGSEPTDLLKPRGEQSFTPTWRTSRSGRHIPQARCSGGSQAGTAPVDVRAAGGSGAASPCSRGYPLSPYESGATKFPPSLRPAVTMSPAAATSSAWPSCGWKRAPGRAPSSNATTKSHVTCFARCSKTRQRDDTHFRRRSLEAVRRCTLRPKPKLSKLSVEMRSSLRSAPTKESSSCSRLKQNREALKRRATAPEPSPT
ncbi:MAG: hypothetical protein RJA70_463 [Pseudomonadota bacterium]